MANEPTFVDGIESPSRRRIYYHSGLDHRRCRGTGGRHRRDRPGWWSRRARIACPGTRTLRSIRATTSSTCSTIGAGITDTAISSRSTRRSSPGATVAMGQKIGVLGKEGGSGGWSHLHFEIVARQPSGRWGTEEGYAFLWQAAVREQHPAVIAVARPHHLALVGETGHARRFPVLEPIGTRSHARTGPSPMGPRPPALASIGSTRKRASTARSSR